MPRFLGLDGIRAIACLLVVFHHALQRLDIHTQAPLFALFQSIFVVPASAGVSVFFVLSGMLLSQPFWQRYLDGREMPDLKQYIIRRAARIMPGFYLVLTLGFIAQMLVVPNIPYAVWRYVSALIFTAGFHYVTLWKC